MSEKISHPTPDYSYCYYLRFYKDGTVIKVSSTGNPTQVITWFDCDNIDISKNSYYLHDKCLTFTTNNTFLEEDLPVHVSVSYEGIITNNGLILRSHSNFNNHREVINYSFLNLDVDGINPTEGIENV